MSNKIYNHKTKSNSSLVKSISISKIKIIKIIMTFGTNYRATNHNNRIIKMIIKLLNCTSFHQ